MYLPVATFCNTYVPLLDVVAVINFPVEFFANSFVSTFNSFTYLFVFHTPLFYARHNSIEISSALAYRKGSTYLQSYTNFV